jgi:hypothetical protein
MGQETIHPTNHAIERFKERVLPLLSDYTRAIMNDKITIKERLYVLTDCVDISEEGSQIVKTQAFLTLLDYPPIPLTLVINPAKKTLVTLYISAGWIMEERKGKIVWRWCV